MNYTKGQLVRHPKWGLGKVVKVAGDKVTVFFRDEAENPKVIVTSRFPLPLAEVQTDPWLDHLDVAVTDAGTLRQYLTHKAAIDKFLRIFPQGFYDQKYIGDLKSGERFYKCKAHDLWNEILGQAEFERLLAGAEYTEIVHRALQVEGKTNLLATFEKAALRDAVRGPDDARDFAVALYSLIYGPEPFEARFLRFAEVLDSLPQPKSATLKWPIQTIFSFLALPKEHLFLKPIVTQRAVQGGVDDPPGLRTPDPCPCPHRAGGA